MIKYDYTLKRDEEDEKNTYTPQFSKELGNLVEIQAPNSSGKSTILNAIALAFYGYDNENIDQELRSEIRNLVEMPHQNIEFEIELEDEDCKIVVSAEGIPEARHDWMGEGGGDYSSLHVDVEAKGIDFTRYAV